MKKILLSLFVGLIGFISFGYCDEYEGGRIGSLTLTAGQTYEVGKGNANVINMGNNLTFCIFLNRFNNGCNYTATYGGKTVSLYKNNPQHMACITNVTISNSVGVSVHNDSNDVCYDGMYAFIPSDELFTQYTSLQCQTEYNLIPIDSVDSEYCENNNLCSVYTGEISTGYSTLFINDIRHESMPFIYVNIPEEFNWDYSTGINDFTIDIEGYNVDTEYIDGIIRTQNYKPSSEDFTNLVGLLAPYTKYLVFLLFVFVVWAWIKKPFKSKKL